MRVIIPMTGRGTRFIEAGYTDPKPLIKVDGRPIIAHLLDQFPASWPKVFICNQEHLAGTELRRVLEEAAPGCVIVSIEPHSKGPVFAVLDALRLAPEAIPKAEPCLINYCDFSFSWDPHRFEDFTRRTQCDGAVVCYSGFHPEYIRPTLYAYCRERDGRLLEIREKEHFTPDRTQEPASSGTYFFKSGELVHRHVARLMEEGPLVNGEGYVSVVYNQLIRDRLDVRVYEIPWFLQWGTPSDLRDYQYWSSTYRRGIEPEQVRGSPPLQLLMPMAGRGSRFGDGPPKFLRPVLGQAMFRSAMEHLPPTTRQVFVTLKEHEALVGSTGDDSRVVALDQPTEGQAITCAMAMPALLPDTPVLVSSCDHGLVWDQQRWAAMVAQDPDLIVVGQRGYSGADVTPEAFAYIAADGDRVKRVSVKQTISKRPREDLLLVGTFYFKRPALMADLVTDLRARRLRVNGEFYLDSVVNLAVARGLAVRVFETTGYLGWGTPDAVREFEWWHAWFSGQQVPPASRPG